MNSTHWQKALDELQAVKRENLNLSTVIVTLNEHQSRSQENQRQFDSLLEGERARYRQLQLELNHWKARYIQQLGSQMEIPTASEFSCL